MANADPSSKKLLTAFAAALLLLALGFAVLWMRAPAPKPAAPAARPAPTAAAPATPGSKVDSVDVLLERLRARLEREPNDVDGWVLLGRSYHFLQRWDEATAAFKKARELGWQGEAPALNADASATAGNAGTAPAPAPMADPVFQGVQAAVQQQAQALRNPEPAPAANAAGITAVVSADSSIVKKFSADTAVFVFLRPASGPRMPLAVVRKRLGELPATIELGDAQAMLPERRVSGAETVIVGARLSPSGNPTAQPGDVEILSSAVAPHGQSVALQLGGTP